MIVDSLVLAVLLISALVSFLRGVIREILTIAGVIGGSAAAYFGGPVLKPFMREWLGVPDVSPEAAAQATEKAGEAAAEAPKLFDVLPYEVVAEVLSYGVVFIVVVIAISILSHFLAEGAKSIGLGPIDRTLGFIFGILRGVLLLGIVYLPVYLFIKDEKTKEEWFKDSKTHFYLEQTSMALASFVPESAKEDLERSAGQLSEADKTRRKLEDINLLKGTGEKVPPQDMMQKPSPSSPPSGSPPADAPKPEGYDGEFRDTMDRLFKDKTDGASNP